MLSQRKAIEIERAYRALLYRRPWGVFPVVLFLTALNVAVGLSSSAMGIAFPFLQFHIALFVFLILAIAGHWIMEGFVHWKKRNPAYVFIGGLGIFALFLGAAILVEGFIRFSSP
jgi:hypothetical protein